jgi:hypothetical protein
MTPTSDPNQYHHHLRLRVTRQPFARALVVLAACAGCAGAPPKDSRVAQRPEAEVKKADVAEAKAAGGASSETGAAPSCAVKTASLTPAENGGEDQCLEGLAPRVSDLRITLTPATPTVSPGGRLILTLRITNVSDHTVSVRTELPHPEHLVVTTEAGVAIAPPAGPMPIELNPNCGGTTCSHVIVSGAVVVPLLPGGVIEDSIVWQASHMAWPPPRLQDCVASCMGTDVMIPIATKPLAPGKYRLQTALRAWSEPEWLALNAEANVLVR